MRRPILCLALVLAVAGCGGGEEVAPVPNEVEGTISTPTQATGAAAAGKQVFTAQGCGSCHTYGPAGSKGQVGPNLSETLQGKDADYIHESIVSPNAKIAAGFSAGIMPQNYGETLSDKQLADLVAFLTPSS